MTLQVETKATIGRPVEQVFDAWVDPRKMSGYFISSGSERMEAGKTVVWSWEEHDLQLEVDVQTVAPNRQLTFEWSASGVPSRVVVDFKAEDDGTTRVTVRDGGWESDAQGIARYGEQMQGWVHMLTCLKGYLEYEAINLRQTPVGTYSLQVQRSMKANASELYRAWTQEWDRWFATPGSVLMQPQVGLPFCFDVTFEGKRYPHHGRFLRLDEDRLVEHTWVTEATRGVETRVTVELTAEATGTRVRLSHTGFGDQAAMKGHEDAWPEGLAHLDGCLAPSP